MQGPELLKNFDPRIPGQVVTYFVKFYTITRQVLVFIYEITVCLAHDL